MPTTVGEISETIKEKLTDATEDIDKTLKKVGSESIVPAKQNYIVDNRFWDKWLQKLFSQLISVKIWGLTILTILVSLSLISGEQFIIGFSLIMTAKGGKDIVMKWVANKKNNNSEQEDEIIDRV